MGTPDRYEEVTGAVESGLVMRRNLARPQKCIFMDRDGTINVEYGFLKDPERLELLPGTAEAIRKINASPYLAVVITNQPVIARGECSFETLDKIHQRLERILGQEGAYLDGLLYCPHHPDAGFEGEIPDLKFACGCRKPAPGMILEAFDRWHITPEGSWMIGDRTQDILCGLNAGLRTALVETGAAGKDGKYEAVPSFTAPDLLHAVEKILEDGCE
jgi:D,D-heptose 1,7-bisphosphate phosphatase